MPARRPNSWFSSSKAKAPSGHLSSMTLGQAMSAARKAGHASGDTGAFDSWLRSKGLSSRGNVVIARLRQEYNRGFEDKFSDAEKREQQRATDKERAADRKREADRRAADRLNAAYVKRLDEKEAAARKKQDAAAKHAKSVTARFGAYKGYSIFKTGDGAYHYSGEKESAFDSLKDVKRFVDSLKRNPKRGDVIDQAAAMGMEIYQGIFAIPSAVLDKTIATSLQAKDAVKRRLNPGWYDEESESDARNSLMHAAQTSRNAEELGRIHRWAVGKRDTELKQAVEDRAAALRIPMSQIKGSYPRGWNPQVTDRALRYRANATPPEGAKQCAFCGAKTTVEVGHVDGHEENCEVHNLIWTCRSCNVLCANTMRNAGLGRLTRQYNPKGEGAKSVNQWVTAVMSMKGLSSAMPVSEAVELVHNTPPAKRSEFARSIWSSRRERGTYVTSRWNPKGKKNPESGAAHFYKKFHGRDSEEELILETEIHEHEWLGVLGVLCAVAVDTPTGYEAVIHFDEKAAPWLCSSEDGTQLFIEGGNQEIDLAALKMNGDNWEKERMVLGQFSLPQGSRRWNLSYVTEKDFDKFEVCEYQHDLGEANEDEAKSQRRESPLLEYDAVNKLLYIVGGQYKIELPAFETSPGIEN